MVMMVASFPGHLFFFVFFYSLGTRLWQEAMVMATKQLIFRTMQYDYHGLSILHNADNVGHNVSSLWSTS